MSIKKQYFVINKTSFLLGSLIRDCPLPSLFAIYEKLAVVLYKLLHEVFIAFAGACFLSPFICPG